MSDTLLAALIAALAAFLAAGFTVTGTIVFDRYKKFKNKNLERISVLNALHADLSTLNDVIIDRKSLIDRVPSSSPERPLTYLPISHNYFSVFDNFSTKVGLINNPGLIKQVIRTYTEVKGLFDDVKSHGNNAVFLKNLLINPPLNKEIIDVVANGQLLMLDNIVTNRVPQTINQINDCIQEINREKETIQRNNNFSGFYKYLRQ